MRVVDPGCADLDPHHGHAIVRIDQGCVARSQKGHGTVGCGVLCRIAVRGQRLRRHVGYARRR